MSGTTGVARGCRPIGLDPRGAHRCAVGCMRFPAVAAEVEALLLRPESFQEDRRPTGRSITDERAQASARRPEVGHRPATWATYVAPCHDRVDFAVGARVLDLGCGEGRQLAALAAHGCRPTGVDRDAARVRAAADTSVPVVVARGEALPLRSQVFDGVLCRVVLPYTDEARVLAEIARVLRPGGECELSGHGLGYYLGYLLRSTPALRRIYAARTLLNTWLYRVCGIRCAIGDTIYQSRRRLRRFARQHGLEVVAETPSRRFLGLPVFIYVRLRKAGVRERPGEGPSRIPAAGVRTKRDSVAAAP